MVATSKPHTHTPASLLSELAGGRGLLPQERDLAQAYAERLHANSDWWTTTSLPLLRLALTTELNVAAQKGDHAERAAYHGRMKKEDLARLNDLPTATATEETWVVWGKGKGKTKR